MNSQEPNRKSPMKDRSRRRSPVIAALAILVAVLVAGLFAVIADRPCPLAAGPGKPAALTTTPALATPASAGMNSADGAEILQTPPAGHSEDLSAVPRPQARDKAARQALEKLVDEQKFEAAAAEGAPT